MIKTGQQSYFEQLKPSAPTKQSDLEKHIHCMSAAQVSYHDNSSFGYLSDCGS